MIIKICGIKNTEDAIAAIDLGADMLGYNFYPKSKRYISIKECVEIQNGLAKRGMDVISVGVFVNASYETIIDTMDVCALNLVQLHGDEAPELLEKLGEWAFKAIRPQSVEEALKTPARELISAARRPATTKPRTPMGRMLVTNRGDRKSVV